MFFPSTHPSLLNSCWNAFTRTALPEAVPSSRAQVDTKPPYQIVSGQSDEWRLRFFVRLAIELLTAGSQAADGTGFQLFVARSKKQTPIIFCGCGTTVHAAQKLGRRWIGIDITYLAINLIRLKDAFGEEIEFERKVSRRISRARSR
jgi:hypothetical protein